MFIDVEAVLLALGIDAVDAGTEFRALCPMHRQRTGQEDHSPSWYVNQDTGRHICFSCGYKGNLAQLVCDINEFYVQAYGKITGYDYEAAQQWIAQVSEVPIEKLQDIFNSLPNYIKEEIKPLEMSEARLAVFIDPPQDALDSRKITLEAAQAFGVLWDDKKKNWILPLYEPHFNRLIGWQEKGTVHRTFFNRPTGLKRSKTLFGLANQSEEQVIVVESPLDCVRLASIGYKSAVAICGSGLSDDQLKLLRASDKVIAAFDNDSAGRKASKEISEWARKYGINLWFFNYGNSDSKDPGDMTEEQIRWGIENAISALYGESAYVQGNAQTLSS
jgi:hypothetical protein